MTEENKVETTPEQVKEFLFGTMMDSYLQGFTVYMNKLAELELTTGEMMEEVIALQSTMLAEAANGIFVKHEDKEVFVSHVQKTSLGIVDMLQKQNDSSTEETQTESGIILK